MNKHIVIYKYNPGLKFWIKKHKNKTITILNKFKKPINKIDKTIYNEYNLITEINMDNIPTNSTFKFKICNSVIELDSIKINGKFINNTSNQIYYAKLLNVKSKNILFEGKVTNKESYNALLKEKNIAVLSDNKLNIYNITKSSNTEYVQFINKDIVEYFTDNSIFYPLYTNTVNSKYIEIICNMFKDWINQYNDKINLPDSFGYNLSTDMIPIELNELLESKDNQQLLQLFLTLFYDKKKWRGYMYDDNFIDQYNNLKKKIINKINSKNDLFFIK